MMTCEKLDNNCITNDTLKKSNESEWRIIGGVKKWIRNCPQCKSELFDANKSQLKQSILLKRKCSSCSKLRENLSAACTEKMKSRIGIKNPMYGKFGKNNPNFGRKSSKNAKDKMRGKNNPNFGKVGYWTGCSFSDEHRKKLSKSGRIYTYEVKHCVERQKSNFRSWIHGKCRFEKCVGLTLREFKIWISLKFKDGMSWETHGRFTWHLDHIRPLSSFNLMNDIEMKQAWHYKNFQPLWWRENLSKGHNHTLNSFTLLT